MKFPIRPSDPKMVIEREYEIHEAGHAIVLACLGVQGISVTSRKCRFDSDEAVSPRAVLTGLWAGYYANLLISECAERIAQGYSRSDKVLQTSVLSRIPASEREQIDEQARQEAKRLVIALRDSIRQMASQIRKAGEIDSASFETLECVKTARKVAASDDPTASV